ncbi:MAG: folate family ECF transporter S component [Oscillospiraceae bacterium]|nr:folate family ECF transporter S component [Oscillospiraceae bacterium]
MLKKLVSSAHNLISVRGLVLTAMLIAMYAVLGIFKIPFALDNRITLTFTATASAGIILGPLPAMLVGGIGDILGYLMNPGGGAYFVGFTISAMLGGLIYGFCLYGIDVKQNKMNAETKAFLLTILSCAIITFFINIILNTYWLSLMYGKAYTIFSAARIIKNFVVYPFHVIVIQAIFMLTERTGIRKKYL